MVILFFDPRGYEGKVVQVVIEIYMSADTSHAKERAKDLWEKRNIKQFIFMRYVNENKLKMKTISFLATREICQQWC